MLEIVRPILNNRDKALNNGAIEVRVELDGDDLILRLDGFYKHGSVSLKMITEDHGSGKTSQKLQVKGRYGFLDEFYDPTFKDLVGVNYFAYLDYKDKGYEVDKAWAPWLVEYGYLKVETKTVYVAAK